MRFGRVSWTTWASVDRTRGDRRDEVGGRWRGASSLRRRRRRWRPRRSRAQAARSRRRIARRAGLRVEARDGMSQDRCEKCLSTRVSCVVEHVAWWSGPDSMKPTVSATSRANPISCVPASSPTGRRSNRAVANSDGACGRLHIPERRLAAPLAALLENEPRLEPRIGILEGAWSFAGGDQVAASTGVVDERDLPRAGAKVLISTLRPVGAPTTIPQNMARGGAGRTASS
jgi:hypothetical protein